MSSSSDESLLDGEASDIADRLRDAIAESQSGTEEGEDFFAEFGSETGDEEQPQPQPQPQPQFQDRRVAQYDYVIRATPGSVTALDKQQRTIRRKYIRNRDDLKDEKLGLFDSFNWNTPRYIDCDTGDVSRAMRGRRRRLRKLRDLAFGRYVSRFLQGPTVGADAFDIAVAADALRVMQYHAIKVYGVIEPTQLQRTNFQKSGKITGYHTDPLLFIDFWKQAIAKATSLCALSLAGFQLDAFQRTQWTTEVPEAPTLRSIVISGLSDGDDLNNPELANAEDVVNTLVATVPQMMRAVAANIRFITIDSYTNALGPSFNKIKLSQLVSYGEMPNLRELIVKDGLVWVYTKELQRIVLNYPRLRRLQLEDADISSNPVVNAPISNRARFVADLRKSVPTVRRGLRRRPRLLLNFGERFDAPQ